MSASDEPRQINLLHVLCCGGRKYRNTDRVFRALDKLRKLNPSKRLLIIEGGATGADDLCAIYSNVNKLPHLRMPAEWEKLGKRAGQVRNKQMLDVVEVDCVVAFPGGDGTANMVAEARKRGIKVYEVKDE